MLDTSMTVNMNIRNSLMIIIMIKIQTLKAA